jgi:CheY-like chemotaxis protein
MDDFNLNNTTVLIVEDDEMNATYLMELMEEKGAKSIHVDNASDAIYSVSENKNIALVLMDIQLPDMNGWQATKIIKKVNKDLPVIIQSAFSMDSHVRKSMEAGCDFFIAKPVDSRLLFDMIKKVIQ